MNEMNPITNFFPYTDYHSMNLDFILDLACASFGLHLVVDGQYLKLVNKCGQEISKVTIAYSETALKDTDGHNINAYVLSAGADSHNLLITHGDGNVTTITIPYSVKAEYDVNDHSITSYVRSVTSLNDKIVITFGDGTTFEITVPYAVKARDDKNGKDITSYVALIEPVADKLIVKDGNGTTISEITVPYAEKALKDGDGDVISATYGATLSTGTSTVILRNKNGVQLSEITVPYAERALKDVDGNNIKSTYGASLAVNGSKIALNARDGSNLNEITVPFATLSNDANNAIENVSISGDTITFTTFDGQVTTITVPYAVKALKDSLNNTISTTYVANVTTDPITGKFSFFAGDGSLIAEMIPTVDKAVHDSFNNTIADYIKTIVTDPNSNYVTVTHGDGDVDSITIEYATKAWKDTYGNIIGNVYIKSLEFETIDNEDYLIAYNGEDSELFRIKIVANNARYDINDNPITSYVRNVALNLSNEIEVTHGDGNVDTITLPSYSLDDLTDVTITTPADGEVLKYDSNSSEWVNSTVPDELNELSDVTITTPADGEVLKYDSNSSEWVNSTVPDELNELSDVTITTPADGDILEYDSNNNEWINKEHIKNPYVVIDYTSIGTIELTDSTTSVNLGAPVGIYGYTSENENRESITISELVKRVQKGANVVLQIPFSQGAGRFWLSNIQYDASIMSGNKNLHFNGVVHMETNGHNYECEVSIDSQNNLYTLTVKSVVDTVENDFIIFEAGQSVTSATELQRIYKLLQRGKMPFFKTTNMTILPLDSYMCSKSGVSIPLTTTISEFAKMTHPTSSPYDMIILVFYQKAGSGTSFQATSKSIQIQFNGTTLNGITVPS